MALAKAADGSTTLWKWSWGSSAAATQVAPAATGVTAIAAGNNRLLFLDKNGMHRVNFGDPKDPQSKIIIDIYFPSDPSTGLPPKIADIKASNKNWAALAYGRILWAGGDNTKGQLGQGDQKPYFAPVEVKGLPPQITSFAVGPYTMAASDGTKLWIWGQDLKTGNPITTPQEVKIQNIDLCSPPLQLPKQQLEHPPASAFPTVTPKIEQRETIPRRR
jgi:alpha-tubulin suppressor-like RCC1 family protein